MAKFNSKYTSVALHVLIWSLLLTLPHVFIDNNNIRPGSFPTSFYTITNLYNIGLFYLNAFVLYPLFFNKRKWWIFILSAAFLVFISYHLKLFIAIEWYPDVLLDEIAQRILFFPPIPFLIVSTVYRLVTDKIAYDKKQKELVAEQLSMKLKFLRSQISPHFIFNVLTNLVSLARKKSDQLEPQLIKLSELMRYILYESDEQKVLLSTEIEYLKSYIELQKMRFGDDVLIDVRIEVPENEWHWNIEPMLLIPFVENAFKHGIGVDNPLIVVTLKSNNGMLEFEVKNKFDEDSVATKDNSSGIGLENVRSRLALLYAKEYTLVTKKENNIFYIHLTLQLR